MKKSLYVVGLVVIGLAGGAWAGTLEGAMAWAEKAGTAAVSNRLVQCGVGDAADIAAITAAWDEATVVDRALGADAFYLLYTLSGMDRFSSESARKIRGYLEGVESVPAHAWEVVSRLALEERPQFQDILEGLIEVKYPAQPCYGRLALKYAVMEGKPVVGGGAELGDLLDLLLAAEPMEIRTIDSIKRVIKAKAIVLARHHLRAIGKTFVAQGDVNPLAEAIRPTVDALNAPKCEGLEKALRDIGGDVADRDRAGLLEAAAEWQREVMVGDRLGHSIAPVLGRISVALGVKGFNAFVDGYNNGTGNSDG